MKYTENDIKVGTKMTCIDNKDTPWWTNGKIYEVKKSKSPTSGICIIDDQDSERYLEGILARLNNGSTGVKFEIVEEEKEMKKYAKITKYAGLIDSDKEKGLEIGKENEIVKFSSVSEDCYVYLNEEHPNYFISETQYELVEKEEKPTLKANVNVDVKEVIQAKIEQLRTDAEIIANKRNRMEWQMFNLNSKANKLEEVIETIKEFE